MPVGQLALAKGQAKEEFLCREVFSAE